MNADCWCWLLLVVAAAGCCCWLLLLVAAAGCCCWLLLLVATAGCCCWLLLLVAAAGRCCWLLLLVAAAGCCCWLLLLVATAGCCCWLLLLVAAAGRCCWLLLLVAAVDCCCWLLAGNLWNFPGYWCFAAKTILQAKNSLNIFGLLMKSLRIFSGCWWKVFEYFRIVDEKFLNILGWYDLRACWWGREVKRFSEYLGASCG